MKNTLVALFGASNTGKSTSLKKFINNLEKNKNFKPLYYDKDYPKDDSNDMQDFAVIFDYKGIKVGISTAGDTPEIIRKYVEECLIKKYECKIIFTASRSRNGTVEQLKQIGEEHKFELKWIQKLYRTYDPIIEIIGTEKNKYLDKITELEVEYLTDYLIDHLLKNK